MMTRYREIKRNIAFSCNVSRNTISKILKKAKEMNKSWSFNETMTDEALEKFLFPRDLSATKKHMLDYNSIRHHKGCPLLWR